MAIEQDPYGTLLNLPEVAERFGIPVTSVRQLLKDGKLLAVRVDGVLYVPEILLATDEPEPVKGLPGLIMLLRDGRFSEEEILRWMFTADDSLPGRPADALAENRMTEVRRRAQALGF
ncbi:MAG TPA: Rv2175c family DNA-binding protein [Frankiaceae bacterium]